MTAADKDRYLAALHAMQSGVAAEMPGKESEPKHLRVGVNSALVNDAAIARLLIAKGVITIDEYTAACADEMEAEVRRYEQRLAQRLGSEVTLK